MSSIRHELDTATVFSIIRSLDSDICEITGLHVSDDGEDNDGQPVYTWSATVEMLNGETYEVSVPDHWPEGAEIHY